ncbi:MAG: MMPL family transporter [Kosmotogaceae bacterium]
MNKKFAVLILTTVGVATLVLLLNITNLRFGSFEELIPDDYPSSIRMTRMEETFPAAEKLLLVVSVGADDFLLNPDNSESLYNVVEVLKNIDGVLKVNSIFDARDVSFSGFSINAQPFFENGAPLDNAEQILKDAVYVGNLINEKGTTALIAMDVNNELSVDAIRDTLKQLPNNFESFMTGNPVIDDEMKKSIMLLTYFFPPLLFLLMWILYFLRLGDFRAALMPPLIALIAALWTYGIASMANLTLNMLTSTIGLFIIIVSSSYGLHIVDRYMRFRDSYHHFESIKMAVADEKIPLFLSALTTAVGFLTFVFSAMEAMRYLGILVALGVGISFFFTLVVIPSILTLMDLKAKHKHLGFKIKSNTKFARYLAFGMLILLIASPFFIRNLEVNSDQFSYFKDNSEIVKATEKTKETFGWVLPMYVVLQKDGVFTSEDSQSIEQMILEIEQLEGVSGVYSLLDISKSYNIPLPMLNLFAKSSNSFSELSEFVSGNSVRFLVKTPITDANGIMDLNSKVEDIIAEYPRYSPYVASTALVNAGLNNGVVENQVTTIFVAFGAIAILLIVVFRKILLALIAVVPIVTTTVLNFSYMSILGMNLEVSTAIIAGVLMGLIIDYSIHLLSRYRKLSKKHNKAEASDLALRDIGPVIIASGLSLSAGFSSLFFAPLKLFVVLGILLVLGVITGVASTLVFVPQLLSPNSSKKKK